MQVHAEIIISHESGIETIISTKPGCTCFPSPILDSNIYDGEIYDARSEVEHWCTPGPVTTKTFPAVPATEPEGRINDRLSLPVTIRQEIPSPKIIYTPANELVMDFGQIVTGWVAFTNVLPANSSVHFDYGELLQNGNFYNENLRSALAQYTYYSSGKRELVRPHFTFYGFRYVRVHGVTEEQLLDMQVHACVLCTKLEDTGFITTSNAKINRLIQNAKWSQIGNFLDVPTDCPQRDERMGWTGDAQVFCATASFLSYTPAFYKKYLYDMLMEQGKNIFCGHIIDRLTERHAYKELIEACLVIHKNQIRPAAFLPEGSNLNMVLPAYIGSEEKMNKGHHHTVPEPDPLFFLFHRKTSFLQKPQKLRKQYCIT